MGRQKGDPNRSKSRPSSSSAAASLVQNTKTSVTGFGGYIGSSRIDSIDTPDKETVLDLDGEAALHLRRLSKKDPITRIKALKALDTLFKEHPVNILCQLLPNWIFEYRKLVQDESPQVREATHNAMSSLAVSVGRGMAPHLRSVMGAWWVSQFDPAKEVSAAAQQSFQAAFQGAAKRLEALMFCASDVFTYIDGLLRLSPQTISERSAPVEESTKKYEQVVSSALLALAALIDVVFAKKKGISSTVSSNEATASEKNKDKIKEIEDMTVELSENHKYFKDFVKSKSSQIRCASYQMVRAFAQNVPIVFTGEGLDIISSVALGSFSEKEPSCHQAMWDMVLLVSQKYPEAWATASIRKVVLPRLWNFLRHATYGSAHTSYPCLLPLLSLLPVHTIYPVTKFLTEFFSSLWEGHTASCKAMEDELALLKAMQECVCWIINNAERYVEKEEISAEQLQAFVVENVVLKILWKGYVFAGRDSPPNRLRDHSGALKESTVSQIGQEHLDDQTMARRLPGSSGVSQGLLSEQVSDTLRMCIIDVLANISGKNMNLISDFWNLFQDICLEGVICDSRCMEEASILNLGCTRRIYSFFCNLNKLLVSDEVRTTLIQPLRILVARLYILMKSVEFSECIQLIAKIVSIFRPLLFPAVEIYQIEKGESCSLQYSYEDENVLSAVFSFFECDLVPWCLDGNVESSSAKIELLLSFFEDERFLKEWEFVLSYATQLEDKSNGDNILDVKRVTVLASFVEKLRWKLFDLCKGYSAGNNGSDPVKLWNLSKLEAAAVTLAQSVSLSHPASLQLLRCLLGGSMESSFPMMSTATVVQVTTILLQRVLQVLLKTEKTWAQYAASSLLKPDVTLPLTDVKEDNMPNDLGYAAVEALSESISCLHCIDGQSDIVPKVLASLYCIAWAHSCCSESDLPDLNNLGPLNDGIAKLGIVTDYQVEQRPTSKDGEDESDEEVSLMTDTATHVTEAPHKSSSNVFHILNRDFCRGLSADTRNVIQYILAQCVRNAILEESIDASQMAYLCAKWVVNLIDQICIDFEERDEFMSLLLQPNDCWPLFTAVPARVDEPPTIQHYWKREGNQADKHIRFVAFVAKVSSFTGWENLILYSIDQDAKNNEAEGQDKERESRKLSRIWVVIELLCSWQWPGGSAGDSVIPFLISCSAHSHGTIFETILDVVMKCLLSGVLLRNYVMEFTNKFWMGLMEDMDEIGDPCLRALLVLLKKILQASSPDEMINHVERFFHVLVSHKYLSDSLCNEKANTLPFIHSALIPVIRKQKVSSHTSLSLSLEAAVCRWLSAALSAPPSTAFSASDWQHGLWIAISCFPLHPAGGSVAIIAASSACTSLHEKELLLALFRKEISTDAVSGYVSHTAKQQALLLENTVESKDLRQAHQETLAKLVAATIAYCWKELDVEDWSHVINHMRIWLEAALYEAEHFTKLIADCIDATDSEVQGDFQGLETIDRVKLLVTRAKSWQTELSWTAVCIFFLIHAIEKLGEDSSESSHCLPADWLKVKQRTLNYILRIFFSNGMAESVVMDSSAGHEAAMLIADARIANNHFWENVSEIVLSASDEEKTEAARYINIWTVGKDSIRSLYALLFSPHPIGELQLAAYCLLTHSPFKQSAVTYDELSLQQDQSEEETLHLGTEESSLSQLAKIRPELAAVLEMSPLKINESSFTSSLRVQYLLAWAIFLTHLYSITVSSSAGERLVQYIQDTNISSMFLDILFQHVSLKLESGSHGKRKATIGLQKSEAGKVEQSARRAAASGSVVFAVEGLWPLDVETTSVLAAALYGIMLRVLPACVRDWFAGLRDRAMVSSVEAFTTNHCSPQLLADEFTQVHRATIADETLTIRANQSIGEVTVVYKKEEAGMDMVIRMPKCYPLRPVDVECTRRLGISETRLRKWMLSMAAFLRNQNGAVAEAIQIWKRNVDREFEGVEECPICYSIIHTANHSLPRLACKTCRHKFHAACLYKWFSTSHKSTCPLCQTPF